MKRLAVFASDGGKSHVEAERRKDLVIASADLKTWRRLKRGLGATVDLVWSPNGEYLAARFRHDGHEGVWLVSATSGHAVLFAEGNQFGSVAWLSDGRLVIARDWIPLESDQALGGVYVSEPVGESDLPR